VSQTEDQEELSNAGFFKDIPAPSMEAAMIATSADASIEAAAWSNGRRQRDRVSLWKELKVLLRRDVRDLCRDYHTMAVRCAIYVVGSCLIVIVYAGVGERGLESHTSFLSHVGAVFLLVVTNLIAFPLVIIEVAQHLHVFVREYNSDHYRLFSCKFC
jgi:hypothetical protein